MSKLVKGSKEWAEAKAKAREELERRLLAGEPHAAVVDTTVGHVEGPAGTWNTSGVELPIDPTRVRDVRPETRDAVSLEGLKEVGVPVRTEADRADLERELEAAAPAEGSDVPVRKFDEPVEDEKAEKPAKKAARR